MPASADCLSQEILKIARRRRGQASAARAGPLSPTEQTHENRRRTPHSSNPSGADFRSKIGPNRARYAAPKQDLGPRLAKSPLPAPPASKARPNGRTMMIKRPRPHRSHGGSGNVARPSPSPKPSWSPAKLASQAKGMLGDAPQRHAQQDYSDSWEVVNDLLVTLARTPPYI